MNEADIRAEFEILRVNAVTQLLLKQAFTGKISEACNE